MPVFLMTQPVPSKVNVELSRARPVMQLACVQHMPPNLSTRFPIGAMAVSTQGFG